MAGVAYLTLTVHAARGASGTVNEQVLAVTLYKPPMLIVRASSVICSGAAPVLVTVMTLVTAARGVGIVKVRVRMPRTVPSTPLVAEVKLSVPADAVTTVNVTVLLVPPGVVTLTVWAPSVAVPEIVKFALIVVAFTTVRPLTVMPVAETFTAVAPVRLVPVRVTGSTRVPRAPDAGKIEVRVGAGVGATTVNVTLPLVPPGVVTLTVLGPSAAVAAIVKVAVTEVPLTTTMLLAVTNVPDTVTAVVPVRFVPVRVTLTAVPWAPDEGAIEVSVGAGAAAWNSTAPTSIVFGEPASGLALPKKSVGGAIAKAGELDGMRSMAGEPAAKA